MDILTYEVSTVRGQGHHEVRVVAVRDTWCASVPAKAIDRLVHGHLRAATAVLRGLSGALFAANDAATNLAFKDAPGLVATLLLDLERRFGRYSGGLTYVEHGLRQSDLGQTSGCTREAANKVLTGFARRGVLTLDRMGFELLDRDWLVKRAR